MILESIKKQVSSSNFAPQAYQDDEKLPTGHKYAGQNKGGSSFESSSLVPNETTKKEHISPRNAKEKGDDNAESDHNKIRKSYLSGNKKIKEGMTQRSSNAPSNSYNLEKFLRSLKTLETFNEFIEKEKDSQTD